MLVVLLSFTKAYQVELDYLLLLITAMSMYAIGYFLVSSPGIFKTGPMPELQSPESVTAAPVNSPESTDKSGTLRMQLLRHMDAAKPYRKSDLKISDLADTVGIPTYQLSQLINEGFKVKFYDFINQYRVDEAKKLLVEDTRGYKILAIAYEVGFNSKATFNRVFKNSTGLTPSEFRARNLPPSADFVSAQA
jgi:AraC-like DNA-binding protein